MTSLAIIGATGVVGRTMLSILEERNFPVDSLRLMASSRSAGSMVPTRWGEVRVEELTTADPVGIDVALFSAGADRSRAHAPRFSEARAVVIDNSSAFRDNPEIPLVVAGVNHHHLIGHSGIISSPNCTTMALMVAANPLHRAAEMRSIVATSFQAVSGSGSKGIVEMLRQTRALLEDPEALQVGGWKDPGSEVYVRPIAFNVVPYAGIEKEYGYADEEWKLVNESRKILDAPGLQIEPTCVRVPAVTGHGISATLHFDRPMGRAEAIELLGKAPRVDLWTDSVPTPSTRRAETKF